MEYVQEEEGSRFPSFNLALPTTPAYAPPPPTAAPTEKRKYVRKNKVNPEREDDETRRKLDILASVACLENIEDYVGEKIKPIEFRNMTKERLEALFDLYQQKAGQELAEDGMSTVIKMLTRVLKYCSVEIKEEEKLEQDLMENRFLKRTIGRQSCKIAEQYGDLVGILKAVADVCKHVSIGASEVRAEALEGASEVQADASEKQNENLRIKWKKRALP